jgi:hypothetical protein
MIEINLLPGTGKKPRNRNGAGFNLSGMTSGIVSKVNDPLLLSGVASVLVATLVIGGMFWHQRAQSSSVTSRSRRRRRTRSTTPVSFASSARRKRSATPWSPRST